MRRKGKGQFNWQTFLIAFAVLSLMFVPTLLRFNWAVPFGEEYATKGDFPLSVVNPLALACSFLPKEWVGFIGAPIMVLTGAVSALFAKLYFSRFTQHPTAAALGGILYACSMTAVGMYQTGATGLYSLPLILIAAEKLIAQDKKGWLSLALAFCMLSFGRSVIFLLVFLAVYAIVRFQTSDWQVSAGRVVSLIWETVLGIVLACVAILPFAVEIKNAVELPLFLFYTSGFKYFSMLTSLFLPMHPMHELSLFLPLVSIVFAVGFVFAMRGHWLNKLLLFCVVVALVPALNVVGSGFSDSQLWLCAPLLIISLMTALAADRCERIRLGASWVKTAVVATVVIIGTAFYGGFSPLEISLNLNNENFRFYIGAAMAVLSFVVLLCLLPVAKRGGKTFSAVLLGVASVMCSGAGALYLLFDSREGVLVSGEEILSRFYGMFDITALIIPAVGLVLWAVYFAVCAIRRRGGMRAQDADYGAVPFVKSESAEPDKELDKYLREVEDKA